MQNAFNLNYTWKGGLGHLTFGVMIWLCYVMGVEVVTVFSKTGKRKALILSSFERKCLLPHTL